MMKKCRVRKIQQRISEEEKPCVGKLFFFLWPQNEFNLMRQITFVKISQTDSFWGSNPSSFEFLILSK